MIGRMAMVGIAVADRNPDKNDTMPSSSTPRLRESLGGLRYPIRRMRLGLSAPWPPPAIDFGHPVLARSG